MSRIGRHIVWGDAYIGEASGLAVARKLSRWRGARLAGAIRYQRGRLTDAVHAAEEDDILEDRRRAEAPLLAAGIVLIDDMVDEARANFDAAAREQDVADDESLAGSSLLLILTIDLLLGLDEWTEETRSRTQPLVERAFEQGFDLGRLRVGADDLAPDEAALRQIVEQIMSKSSLYVEAVRMKIEAAVADSVRAGDTITQAASRILDVAPELSPWKAEQLARTAGGGAHAAGELSAFDVAGVPKKAWNSLLSGSSRREAHIAMHGETVPTGDVFSNGLRFPRDPNGAAGEVISCLCYLSPVFND